jgi:hypothetical protein|tara:strand:+ start:681 stop:1580 length:900 start_codon:yes stop_codon:yes gene_type:complete
MKEREMITTRHDLMTDNDRLTNAFDYTKLSSVMAERPASRTSNRYAFVPTIQLIKLMEKHGWYVSSGRETNAQSEDRMGFQKHMLRFRREGDVGKQLQLDEIIPEILMTNAHDAGAAFNLMSALWRCWCSNGCITADSTIASHRILHKGYADEKVLEAVYHIVEDTPKVIERVNDFKGIQLSQTEREAFGLSALDLLYGEDKFNKFDKQVSVERLIQPRRSKDSEPNLWNSYNVVQEKFLKGDRFLVEKAQLNQWGNTDYARKYARARKTKQVKAIDKDVRLNKALWTLTEEMAKLKQS